MREAPSNTELTELEIRETCPCGGRFEGSAVSMRMVGLLRQQRLDWLARHETHQQTHDTRWEHELWLRVEELVRTSIAHELATRELPPGQPVTDFPMPPSHRHADLNQSAKASASLIGNYGLVTMQGWADDTKDHSGFRMWATPVTTDNRMVGLWRLQVASPKTNWSWDLSQKGTVCCVRVVVVNRYRPSDRVVDVFIPLEQKAEVMPGDSFEFVFTINKATPTWPKSVAENALKIISSDT